MTSESPRAPWTRTVWADVRASLRGESRDFTTGSLGRAILVLAIPMVLEMLMQSVFEVVDIYFVGQLGAEPVAAVGLTASVVILVFAVGLGLAMAAAAVVARRIGEKDPEAAAVAGGQAITLSVLLAVPIGICGVVFAPDLLRLMGGSPSVVEVGTGYAGWIFGGNVTIILLFLINAVFRGAGDPAAAMRALGLANLLNIILDPIFIFGWGPIPAMGVTGAGIATTVGRGVGVGYQLWVLFRGSGHLKLALRHFGLTLDLARRLLKIAGPGMMQYLVGTASWLALMRIVALFGSDALAGYTIAIRIVIFALLPAWGIANAAATMVGQNLGAGQPERAEKAVWLCAALSGVFLSAFAGALILARDSILAVFTPEASVAAVGAEAVLIMACTFPLWAIGMTVIQSFNGAGDTTTPTWINLFVFWVVQLPVAWWLSQTRGMEETGVFVAIAIAQVLMAIVGTIWFRAGLWKLRQV